MIKILILGSSGIIGKHLYKRLKNNKKINLVHTGIKRKLTSQKKHNWKILLLTKPNLIINAIGLTKYRKM